MDRPVSKLKPAPKSEAPVQALAIKRSTYQLLPEMAPEQFEALKEDIAERGVLTPIDIDEEGNILDGHNRYRAWLELKKNELPPTIVRAGLNELEKRAFARKNNILRRHLTREQVRELIEAQLKETPELSDRRAAKELGIDHKTVGAARERLISSGEIPSCGKTVGVDGRARGKPRRSSRGEDTDDFSFIEGFGKIVERKDFPSDLKIALFDAGHNPARMSILQMPRYNPFALCSEIEKLEWHIFALFLIRHGYESARGVSNHLEYLLQKQFKNVTEWLGEEGEYWRKTCGMSPMGKQVLDNWAAFLPTQRGRILVDIENELSALAVQEEKAPASKRRRGKRLK